MKIWRCPLCSSGVRAPARMRRDNALRYCLKCTAKTGKLVERGCPSAASEKAKREAEKRAAELKGRERAAAKSAARATTERGYLEARAREWLKLSSFRDGLRDFHWHNFQYSGPTFQIRLSAPRKRVVLKRKENADGSVTYTEYEQNWSRPSQSSGHAYYGRYHFCVTAGTDRADALATILHEIAHLASPRNRGHGDGWRSVFAAAVAEVTSETPCGGTKRELHDAAADCVRGWMRREYPAEALLSDLQTGVEAVVAAAGEGDPT